MDQFRLHHCLEKWTQQKTYSVSAIWKMRQIKGKEEENAV